MTIIKPLTTIAGSEPEKVDISVLTDLRYRLWLMNKLDIALLCSYDCDQRRRNAVTMIKTYEDTERRVKEYGLERFVGLDEPAKYTPTPAGRTADHIDQEISDLEEAPASDFQEEGERREMIEALREDKEKLYSEIHKVLKKMGEWLLTDVDGKEKS